MPSLAEHAHAIAEQYQPPHIGRPSDIGSESTVRQFLEAVGDGNYIETAAKLAGLSKQSVYEWMKRGHAGEEPFRQFVDAVEKAEARAEAHMVANVRKASELPQFWAAGMTHLERRYPDRWGRRQDDATVPKVVVQIGVGTGDVKVGVATFAPEISVVSGDLHRLSADTESDNKQLCQLIATAAQAAADPNSTIPAVGSGGGPQPGGRGPLVSHRPVRGKGRSLAPKEKRATVSQGIALEGA